MVCIAQFSTIWTRQLKQSTYKEDVLIGVTFSEVTESHFLGPGMLQDITVRACSQVFHPKHQEGKKDKRH